MRPLLVLFAAFALAGPADAAAPRFAVFDLQSDLAQVSKNTYGDVLVRPQAQLAGHGTLVRCATWCRFGSGWLAFRAQPRLAPADVASARVRYTSHQGWTVRLALTAAGQTRWSAFVRGADARAKLRGVPDVLVVVAGGQVAASPLASQVSGARATAVLTGFSKASANALATSLR